MHSHAHGNAPSNAPPVALDPAIRRQTLSDILRRSARRGPDRPAIACGATAWSYAEFDALVTRLAAGLAAEGVGHGTRFAVLARNSHGFAALRFALARLGAVLVPINFMLRPEDVAFILRHAGPEWLATDTGLAPAARAAAALATRVRRFLWLPSEGPTDPEPGMLDFHALAASPAPLPPTALQSTDLAQIVYTSGTESAPKGAMLSHDAILWQYASVVIDAEVAAEDVMLHALPLYHCAQLDVFLGPAVYAGLRSVITATPTPENLIGLIERHAITSFFAPPTVWIGMLRSPLFAPERLASLRKGYYGASIMPVEVLKELAARLPEVRLWNLYGQTEIAPVATVLQPGDQLRKAGSAGRPALNVETRVVDEAGADCPPGVVGEIVHRAPHLMLGYLDDPERTAAAFAGGWFHSGDLGVWDADGYLTVVDRKKDMIKTGGENVASREVEEAIYRHPAVSEVAVIGLPDPKWIEAVTAVVVPRPGAAVSEAEILDHCAALLSPFKRPRRVILAESLPKNPSGKVLKRDLRLAYG